MSTDRNIFEKRANETVISRKNARSILTLVFDGRYLEILVRQLVHGRAQLILPRKRDDQLIH